MPTVETVNIIPIATTASGHLSASEQASLWADLVEHDLTTTYADLLSLVEKTNARTNLDAASATRFAALLEEHLDINLHVAKPCFFELKSSQLQPDDSFWQILAASIPTDEQIQKHLERSRAEAVEVFVGSFVDPLKNAIRDIEIVRTNPGEFFAKLRAFIACR